MEKILCVGSITLVILHLKYSKIISFSMRTGQTKKFFFGGGGGGGGLLISKIKTV